MIKKQGAKWVVDIRPEGRDGPRLRRSFDAKIEAIRFERWVLNRVQQGKSWNDRETDVRRFQEVVGLWYDAKGVHLKDGDRRKRCLEEMGRLMGNPVASTMKPSVFLKYRALKKDQGISDKTLNNHLGYANAVFNELKRVREIDYDNPFQGIDSIALDEKELSWLTREQIAHLLDTIELFSKSPHVHLLTRICLATGARWGEGEGLTLRQVQSGKLTFVNTKSRKTRSVPVSDALFAEIQSHLKEHGRFTGSLSAFRRALKASQIELPKGQAAHVLRHSFASHFVMNGGNILTLQKILGHSTVNMTMRYAHLSPDHLADAIKLGPLAKQFD